MGKPNCSDKSKKPGISCTTMFSETTYPTPMDIESKVEAYKNSNELGNSLYSTIEYIR